MYLIALLALIFGLSGCVKNKDSTLKLTLDSEFNELVGKNTPYWKYVSSDKDHQILNALKAVYQKNHAAQYAQEGNYKIPKVVHCIWLGPRPFPQASVENMRTWVAKHPDWEFKFWTDRKRLPPCAGFKVRLVQDADFSRLKKYYHQATNWGEKADYLRYEILYREGGVYIDHDANALQVFDKLNCAYDFYGCTESPHPPVIDMAVTVGNGLIGTKAKHPILKGCLDYVEKNWQEVESSGRLKTISHEPTLVMERSYIALTRSIMDYLNTEGNKDIVFPASYFFACKYLPSFYSHHFYATAWKAKDTCRAQQRLINEITKQSKRNMDANLLCNVFAGIQLILVVGIIFILKRKYANR